MPFEKFPGMRFQRHVALLLAVIASYLLAVTEYSLSNQCQKIRLKMALDLSAMRRTPLG